EIVEAYRWRHVSRRDKGFLRQDRWLCHFVRGNAQLFALRGIFHFCLVVVRQQVSPSSQLRRRADCRSLISARGSNDISSVSRCPCSSPRRAWSLVATMVFAWMDRLAGYQIC